MERSDGSPRSPLRITVAQPATEPWDVAANARTHATVIDACGSRVVVFPELSLTGYELAAPALDPADHRLAPIVQACRRSRTVALVGAPTTTAPDPWSVGSEHLSVLAIDGDGARVAYHKWFLGGGEPGRFTPGTGPAVLTVDGWRLGLAVCRDTGIAEHAQATVEAGIDVYVAGVCEHEADREVVVERASTIAARHGVWVAVASFAGPTGEGYEATAGGSGLWAPGGQVVARAGPTPGETATAVLVPG